MTITRSCDTDAEVRKAGGTVGESESAAPSTLDLIVSHYSLQYEHQRCSEHFYVKYLFSFSFLHLPVFFFKLKQCLCSEEEDRAVAAAMRASMMTRRQEERAAVVQERSALKQSREERAAERAEAEEARHRAANNKPANKPPGTFFIC